MFILLEVFLTIELLLLYFSFGILLHILTSLCSFFFFFLCRKENKPLWPPTSLWLSSNIWVVSSWSTVGTATNDPQPSASLSSTEACASAPCRYCWNTETVFHFVGLSNKCFPPNTMAWGRKKILVLVCFPIFFTLDSKTSMSFLRIWFIWLFNRSV